MQISKISLIPLLLAAVADATNADRATKPMNRRDIVAKRSPLGGETAYLEKKGVAIKKKRSPAKTKVKTGGGGGGDDDDAQNNQQDDADSDDESDGTSVRLNYAIAAGAGAIAIGAMMV